MIIANETNKFMIGHKRNGHLCITVILIVWLQIKHTIWTRKSQIEHYDTSDKLTQNL